MKPTAEQIAKLPKWAVEYIQALRMERENAVREMRRALDQQTPTKFSTNDIISDGEQTRGPSFYTRYFNADHIDVHHNGVHLQIRCRPEEGISLQWGTGRRPGTDPAAFIPKSYCSAELLPMLRTPDSDDHHYTVPIG